MYTQVLLIAQGDLMNGAWFVDKTYASVINIDLYLYLDTMYLYMDYQKVFKLNKTFTPSAPINNKDLFAGRKEQVFTAISTISQVG